MYVSFLAAVALATTLLTPTVTASYALIDDYRGESLFSAFDFFTDKDPSNGAVRYVTQAEAVSRQLIAYTNVSSYIRIDSDNVITDGKGRPSVRLTSKKTYNRGLFVLDMVHAPSTCAAWPAVWLLGQGAEWPLAGEIDIFENKGLATANLISSHTSSGCAVTNGSFTGTIKTPNCDIHAPGQPRNAGCSIQAPEASYGTPFNRQGGGVFAVEWTSDAIKVWFFPRNGTIPGSLRNGSAPDPTAEFGTPVAQFGGRGCDVERKFRNLQIVANINVCGDFDADWKDSECARSTGYDTCEAYVAKNPQAFKEAYFDFRSLRWYEQRTPAANQTNQTNQDCRSNHSCQIGQISAPEVLANPNGTAGKLPSNASASGLAARSIANLTGLNDPQSARSRFKGGFGGPIVVPQTSAANRTLTRPFSALDGTERRAGGDATWAVFVVASAFALMMV